MLGDIEEGRRARPAVQIFVAAADGELGAVALRSSGTAPALWLRSQTVSAPACPRPAVIRAMSKRSAVL